MNNESRDLSLTTEEWGVVATVATAAFVATANPIVSGGAAIGTAGGICVSKALGWKGRAGPSPDHAA